MKKKLIISTLILFIIDQFIKILATKYLGQINIINNVLWLSLAKNYGIAFSFISGKRILIIIISIILFIFLIYLLKKDYIDKNKCNNYIITTFSLIYSGVLGNLVDRIIRGYVIDYISLRYFSIFNFADICITIGIIMLVINMVLDKENKEQSK